jgi:hypothetical protein
MLERAITFMHLSGQSRMHEKVELDSPYANCGIAKELTQNKIDNFIL